MKTFLFTLAIFVTTQFAHAQSWLTTGNTGTTPPTNYIGTNDAAALQFKVNKQSSGYIDFAAGKANTSFGFQSLKGLTGSGNAAFGYKASFSNTTGKNNTSLGAYALYFNTTGYSNIAVGIGALYKNTTLTNLVAIGDSALYNDSTGTLNTAIGSKALYANTAGSSNTATGFLSLYQNTTGSYNTASGTNAMVSNTTGSYNTANGYQTLYFNTTGTQNTAVGYQALYRNTASLNTAVGYRALYTNSSGSFNVSSGTFSMYNNSTGYSNSAYGYSSLYANTSGYQNTAVGTLALYQNNTGNANTSIGYRSLYTNSSGAYNNVHGEEAMYNNTTGSFNIGIGNDALYNNTYGNYNTAVGESALFNNTGSYYNTAVGYLALAYADNPGYNNVAVGAFSGPSVNTDGVYNSVAVGEECITTASNQARIGNSSTTSIGGYVGWSNISDGRVKKNIKPNVPGLAFINQLQPVTYNLDLEAANQIIGAPQKKDSSGKIVQPTQVESDALKAKEKLVYSGFIAQDVEKAAQSVHYDFSGVDAAKNSKDLYGLRYAEFVVPLVKAVQELSQLNKGKDSVIDAQNTTIDNLESRLARIEAALNMPSSSAVSNLQGMSLSGASLAQNVPNPFSNTTTIRYTLSATYSSAKIILTDKAGKVLQQTTLTGSNGSVTVTAGVLAAGAYQYALYVDGRLIDRKQMILLTK